MGGEGDEVGTWKWKELLNRNINTKISAVPVTTFSHAPLSSLWSSIITEGRIAEVKTIHEAVKNSRCMWFARIVELAGYMAKVRFIGFIPKEEEQFKYIERWIHIRNLFKIGHCKENSLTLHPPIILKEMTVEDLSRELQNYLVGKMSLIPIHQPLLEYNALPRFKPGDRVEVLKRQKGVFQMSLAYVKKTVCRRVQLSFFDPVLTRSKDMWCHEDWEFVKVQGWCQTVGLSLNAPTSYKVESLSEEYFLKDPGVQRYMNDKIQIDKNMMFELVSPLSAGEIVTGKVIKVLEYGYFQYKITSELSEIEEEMIKVQSEFVTHVTSPIIFPCGFCDKNNLTLLPPVDAPILAVFSWQEYLESNGYTPLPLKKYLELAKKDKSSHHFKVGMKLESVDPEVPDLICPATIKQVLHPFMIKIEFDGWGQEFDLWKSYNSTEIFPIGWCELTNHTLELPFQYENTFVVDTKRNEEVVIPKQNGKQQQQQQQQQTTKKVDRKVLAPKQKSRTMKNEEVRMERTRDTKSTSHPKKDEEEGTVAVRRSSRLRKEEVIPIMSVRQDENEQEGEMNSKRTFPKLSKEVVALTQQEPTRKSARQRKKIIETRTESESTLEEGELIIDESSNEGKAEGKDNNKETHLSIDDKEQEDVEIINDEPMNSSIENKEEESVKIVMEEIKSSPQSKDGELEEGELQDVEVQIINVQVQMTKSPPQPNKHKEEKVEEKGDDDMKETENKDQDQVIEKEEITDDQENSQPPVLSPMNQVVEVSTDTPTIPVLEVSVKTTNQQKKKKSIPPPKRKAVDKPKSQQPPKKKAKVPLQEYEFVQIDSDDPPSEADPEPTTTGRPKRTVKKPEIFGCT